MEREIMNNRIFVIRGNNFNIQQKLKVLSSMIPKGVKVDEIINSPDPKYDPIREILIS